MVETDLNNLSIQSTPSRDSLAETQPFVLSNRELSANFLSTLSLSPSHTHTHSLSRRRISISLCPAMNLHGRIRRATRTKHSDLDEVIRVIWSKPASREPFQLGLKIISYLVQRFALASVPRSATMFQNRFKPLTDAKEKGWKKRPGGAVASCFVVHYPWW